jgi:vacuolar-type H+-ATPase subunit F/Vma7
VRVFVLGDADDVTGFALAGVPGGVCQTRADLHEALHQLRAGPETPLLLLVSESVRQLDSSALERLAKTDRGPHLLRLPSTPFDRAEGRA